MDLLNKINDTVWGTPTLLLIFFTGVILTLRCGFFQIRYFKRSFKNFFKKQEKKGGATLTATQSASTALSATLGTGNIIGVAGALKLGGPGAVFWMWVSAVFCMMIKFSEIALAVRYRQTNSDGSYSGGAMYYIKYGLPKFFTPTAEIFCICGIAASFGVGNMTQISTMAANITDLAKAVTDISPKGQVVIRLLVGIFCAVLCAKVIKNDGSIGSFCEKIIPIMTVLYVALTLGAIFFNYRKIPTAFIKIFKGAFNPKSVTGGAVGSAFVGVRFGMSRGVFSNEAGLGTAPIAYACGEGDEIGLGLMGIMEVFIDTVLICTLTALTILCASDVAYGTGDATGITYAALSNVYCKNVIFIFCPVICFFAFSSTVGWGLYGIKFVNFLVGKGAEKFFTAAFVIAVIPAALFKADAIWTLAEILNGIMALPNVTALLFLANETADIVNKAERNVKTYSG